jgi:release factor glutamine methyltransferase
VNDTQAWTIGRLLSWTTEFLQQNDSRSPRLDAEILLAHTLGCQRIELYTRFEEQPAEGHREHYRQLVRRRADGCPVAYLVEHREFYSQPFEVSADVLIPRPETEFVVIEALDQAASMTDRGPLQLADVGTGSGILAICLAQQISNSSVLAIDNSPAALAVAQNNIRRHQLEDRIELAEGDLLAGVDRQLDIIVSNPPYVSEAEYEQLDRDVREFEPRQALVAGPSGMEVYQQLVPQAAERLSAGGWLLLETSPMLAEQLQQLLSDHGAFEEIRLTRDLANLPRVVAGRLKNS